MPRELSSRFILLSTAIVLFVAASLTLSYPLKEESGNGIKFRGNFSSCEVGQGNSSSLCKSTETLEGANGNTSNIYVAYQVVVPNTNGSEEDQKRKLVCCEGVAAHLNGTESLRFIGCGYREFHAIVFWGNLTSNPGIRCSGTPNPTDIQWRYLAFVIPSCQNSD